MSDKALIKNTYYDFVQNAYVTDGAVLLKDKRKKPNEKLKCSDHHENKLFD
jgi:hypothetical protein